MWQPRESGNDQQLLFSKHEHYFKLENKYQQLVSVTASAGKIYKVTDSTFYYLMNKNIPKGKIQFTLKLLINGKISSRKFVYPISAQREYSFKLLNNKDEMPTLENFKNKEIRIQCYYFGLPISCKPGCALIVHVPKRGEMPAPKKCCGNNIYDCLFTVALKKGDRLFLEEVDIFHNNNKIRLGGFSWLVRN